MQLTNISYGNETFNEGFRVFIDMNEQRFRSAFTTSHVVQLSEPLYLGNTNLYVTNGNILGTPDPFLLIPGIVNINGERIVYYEKEGNRLGRLRRGAGGTGSPQLHLIGSDVEDVGPIRYNSTFMQYIPGPQYFAYPSATGVDEGNTIRFQISTINVEPGTTLFWTNEGTSQIADFVGAGAGYTNNGSFVVTGDYNNGVAFVTLSPAMDVSTEGSETIIFKVRTGSVTGTVVATAETVTINDISVIPEYNIVPRLSSIGEGNSISFDINTRGIAGGTTLYWTNSGTTSPTDFLVQTNQGSFVLGGGFGAGFASVKLDTVRNPGFTATKSIVLNLRTGSVSGTIVKTANVVYVTETPDPSYSLSATIVSYGASTVSGGTLAVAEGDQVVLSLYTSGVQPNTTLFYNLSGTTSSSDYNSLLSTGTLLTNGTIFGACANVTISLVEDLLTEGPETLIANVYSTLSFDSNSLVGGPITMNILDTSVAANVIVTPSTLSMSEGQTVTFTLDTDGIRPGNVVYWKNLGTTTSADYDSYPAGTITISGSYRSGTGSISFTAKEDLSPNTDVDPSVSEEGNETLVFAVYLTNPDLGGTPPSPLAAPITVTIGDTSKVTTTTSTTLSPAATPPPGAALVNFFNGDFEIKTPETTDSDGVDHIPGWSIYKPGVGTTANHLRLNGFSTILGWPTPNDPTPQYGNTPSPYGDKDPPVSMTYTYSIVPGMAGEFGGVNVMRLQSSGTSVSYGIVRGPYLVADNPIVCGVGDKVYFHWKAEAGGDDYDVFAYLLDTTNGKTIMLLDSSSYSYGDRFTPWIRVEREIQSSETGTYRFIFICGSMDASGGTALGASLYLDNIDKVSAAPPPWSITVNPPTNKNAGSPFAFNWTAPSEAVGTTQGWFIVNTGTSDTFTGTGITGVNLGSTDNLPTNATSGTITVNTNEISGAAETFQLIITNGPLNGTVLARSPICTLDPAAPSNVISPSCIVGDVITRSITGSTSGGTVWGSNPYTDDSDWSRAAVHAGLVSAGSTATIKFTVLGVQNGGFTGTTANGVTTDPWSTNWCSIQLSLP